MFYNRRDEFTRVREDGCARDSLFSSRREKKETSPAIAKFYRKKKKIIINCSRGENLKIFEHFLINVYTRLIFTLVPSVVSYSQERTLHRVIYGHCT